MIKNNESKCFDFCDKIEKGLMPLYENADRICEQNQYKVLRAMQKNRLSASHLFPTNGYGYNDIGREITEQIYSDIFKTEASLVRGQIISGTHALSTALFGNLRPGDELLSPAGKPYDTLMPVIGENVNDLNKKDLNKKDLNKKDLNDLAEKESMGSLKDYGVIYKQVELLPDGGFDKNGIKNAITAKTKMAMIQRSRGYSLRKSFEIEEIKELIRFIKSIKEDVICMVDNCYGEFTDYSEPSQAGADLCVGSLIKNPGGGIAPVGGYITGKEKFVNNAAYRLTAPGLGKEVGPSLGMNEKFLQGLFYAPQVVCGCIKGAILAAAVFEQLGFEVYPKKDDSRSCIVQAVNMNTKEGLLAFCEGIQAASPVDSFVTPIPWDMPGYDHQIVMAAGAFVQGSSIELSADAPIKPPYTVYMQGGLTYYHAKAGIVSALERLTDKKILAI